MSIQSSLLKPIYVSFSLGNEGDGKIGYSEPIVVYAQTEDVKAYVLRDDVGYVPNYDRYVLVPYGEQSQYIDESSLLWIGVLPNQNKSNSNYKIERVGDVIDGNFILYCNSLTPNTKPIYYEHNGKIYQVKVDYDAKNLVAFTPSNKYLPITNTTKIWTTKPTNVETTKNLLRLIGKQKVGSTLKLKFEKVGE
mgnify:CR=1 FL=1